MNPGKTFDYGPTQHPYDTSFSTKPNKIHEITSHKNKSRSHQNCGPRMFNAHSTANKTS